MTEPTELPINQKEYLKKYLGIGKAPGEKKKKKKKSAVSRVQIIDDDADVPLLNHTTEDDVILANEDAPQIVAIIDERPPSMRVDEKTKNPLWQPIGVVDDNKQLLQKQMIKGFKIQAKSSDKPLSSQDYSPPRRRKHVENENSSPPRRPRSDSLPGGIIIKEERRSVSPDNNNTSSINNQSEEQDLSPPRKRREVTDKAKSHSRNDDDISPPRRNKKGEDLTPPRRSRSMTNRGKSRWDNDSSPPRKSDKTRDLSPPRRSREAGDESRSRSKYNNDSSPPRKSRKTEGDLSPSKTRRGTDKRKSPSKSDNSPTRKSKKTENSVERKDHSPYRKSKKEENNKFSYEENRHKKKEKTSEATTSKHGLVDAAQLVEETQNFQNRQEKLFNSLSTEASGQNSQTIYRDRQTGKIRNLQEEEERQRKKQEEEEKNKEKYNRWGRGLAQVESHTQKLQEELHEMSKPLARYADDEDLERHLKEKLLEGDPMLAYIRKKRRKMAADAGEVSKPQFEGEFMPNRYGIRPGHRWDGVDRSNGYEKKWFEIQNQKKALLEDSYKWSTEDM